MINGRTTLKKEKDKIIRCKRVWDDFTAEHHIDDKTAILVLAGENSVLDETAVMHLAMFRKRKKAERVEILVCKEDTLHMVQRYQYDFPVYVNLLSEETLCAVYDYYCYAFNLDNITFTFLNHCPYNLLGRILDETTITESEAVDLGVFWLRHICVEDKDV
jgi:hypothetical protein